MSNDNLRECPFCGKEMQKREYSSDSEIYVWCGNCGAIGPNDLTLGQAEGAWNMRRSEDALKARIAELEARLRPIPVSERLPEQDKINPSASINVIAFDKHDYPRRAFYALADFFSAYGLVIKKGEWRDCYGRELNNIACWMPLPEMFTEGGTDAP